MAPSLLENKRTKKENSRTTEVDEEDLKALAIIERDELQPRTSLPANFRLNAPQREESMTQACVVQINRQQSLRSLSSQEENNEEHEEPLGLELRQQHHRVNPSAIRADCLQVLPPEENHSDVSCFTEDDSLQALLLPPPLDIQHYGVAGGQEEAIGLASRKQFHEVKPGTVRDECLEEVLSPEENDEQESDVSCPTEEENLCALLPPPHDREVGQHNEALSFDLELQQQLLGVKRNAIAVYGIKLHNRRLQDPPCKKTKDPPASNERLSPIAALLEANSD